MSPSPNPGSRHELPILAVRCLRAHLPTSANSSPRKRRNGPRWSSSRARSRKDDGRLRSLPALRHGKNVMKIHFLWILFWLYACDLTQSQTCMIRVLKVEGDKTVDSPLLLDGSKDVLVSIGRGITIQGTAIKPVRSCYWPKRPGYCQRVECCIWQ